MGSDPVIGFLHYCHSLTCRIFFRMSKTSQISKLKIRKDIQHTDKRIERKLNHIKNELHLDNVKLNSEYFDAMKMETCEKVVQDKHTNWCNIYMHRIKIPLFFFVTSFLRSSKVDLTERLPVLQH